MGGFDSAFRRAADPSLPQPARYLNFTETCSALGGLGGLRIQVVYDALGGQFGFSRTDKPDATQITAALAAMVRIRLRSLHLRSDAQLQERKRKAAGDRAKQPAAYSPDDVLNGIRQAGVRA